MEKINWLDFKGEKNPITESYRTICTNLQAAVDDTVKVIEITSPTANTDKSTVVAGLAITIAQAGKKVLVIDGDYFAPAQHVLFDLPNNGLTDGVASGADLYALCQHCMELENLNVLTNGTAKPVTGGLLETEAVQQFLTTARNEYDYILIDMPSAETSADALVTAPKTDGVLLVVTCGEDKLNALTETKTKLEKAGAKVLGCIVDKVKVNTD